MFRQFDHYVHLHLLYPLKRWLTLQHFAACMMLLYALSLVGSPSVAFVFIGERLGATWFPTICALIFVFGSARLIGKEVSEVSFRVATLPMFLYFFVILVYVLSGQTNNWGAIIPSLAIWGGLEIAVTPLPGDDHDPGTD